MLRINLINRLRQTGVSKDILDNERLKIELVNDICLLAISGWILNNVLFNLPSGHYLETLIAVPQLIFFIILSSVIITTIGLGKSKKIPPPESVEGGFVKPPEDSKGDSGEVIGKPPEDSKGDIVEGGFVTKKLEETSD